MQLYSSMYSRVCRKYSLAYSSIFFCMPEGLQSVGLCLVYSDRSAKAWTGVSLYLVRQCMHLNFTARVSVVSSSFSCNKCKRR